MKNYFYPDDFRKLPIANISEAEQQIFVVLVDKIMAITKEESYLIDKRQQEQVGIYKKEIDQLVYGLYGLTEEEIAMVEKEIGGK